MHSHCPTEPGIARTSGPQPVSNKAPAAHRGSNWVDSCLPELEHHGVRATRYDLRIHQSCFYVKVDLPSRCLTRGAQGPPFSAARCAKLLEHGSTLTAFHMSWSRFQALPSFNSASCGVRAAAHPASYRDKFSCSSRIGRGMCSSAVLVPHTCRNAQR